MDPRRDAAAQRAAPHMPSTSTSVAPPRVQEYHVPPTSSSTAPPRVPEYHVPSSVKPVLNYSIQTGEEFALEFMRDRALSQKHLVPGTSGAGDQNPATTSYMDLRTMLGASHAGSGAGPDVFMLTPLENPRQKESERKPVAQVQNRCTHTSTRSVSQALSSGDGSGRGPSHSSEASDTSRRMKILCSFGGKISYNLY